MKTEEAAERNGPRLHKRRDSFNELILGDSTVYRQEQINRDWSEPSVSNHIQYV